ncbi:hypothetical protein ACTJKO_00620 [Curtobacterium sp. 22159]|uniref:hypothetical protein n=1 Tax=Curtobacterium sp. 22159 TaxID=3453882 RepID=UPI003F86823E
MTEHAATATPTPFALNVPLFDPGHPHGRIRSTTCYRDAAGVFRTVLELTTFVREKDWVAMLEAAQAACGDACLLVTDPLRDLDLTWDEGRRFREVATQLWNRGWFDPYSISDVRGSEGQARLGSFSQSRMAPDMLPAFEAEARGWLVSKQAIPHFASLNLVVSRARSGGRSRLIEEVQSAECMFVSPWRLQEVTDVASAAGFVKVE